MSVPAAHAPLLLRLSSRPSGPAPHHSWMAPPPPLPPAPLLALVRRLCSSSADASSTLAGCRKAYTKGEGHTLVADSLLEL